MKKRLMMIATLAMAICNIGMAEDRVTISDFSISAGETKSINITLDNDATYVSFQFDLYLPEGITVEAYSADRSRLPESTTLSMAQQVDGAYRFISAAMNGEAIKGTSGSIVSLTIKGSADLSHGIKTGYFRDVELSKSDATGPTYAEMSFPITVVEPSIVTAKSYSREYGQENPEFEYEVEGGALEGIPEISCEATKTSPVDTYPIVITKGTVTNYNVTYVNGTLTVTKAPLTITAKDYTIKQGEALPTFEVTYEGFKNDETSEVLTKQPIITTAATSESEPGEYEITVSGAEAQDYDISYFKGKLTIVDADALIVTAKSYEIEYGDDIPSFEYTSEGAELDGTPEIICEATKTSPVGTYPIIITKGTVKNYNDTYVNGTLTIKKAPLKITAKDYTIKQGEALPTFEATYEGFKNDETSEVLTKQPTITTIATSASEPGEYEITISGAEAQNYDISYVMGTLTITAADPVTITAKDYTIEYGDDIPSFEYTSEGATLDGTPSITCEATKTSPVGTYPIVITKGTVKNYNDTYVNGTLTITKAPLTITAKNYTIKQGEALPTFEATYEGFKNDETSEVLTKQPIITTTATSASEPGEYEITVSGAEATNYDINYINGKLTIEASYILGDANGDGVVNVTDIVATVNYIMNKPSDDFNKVAADVNQDGEVNVTDIVGMVNIIMKGGTQNVREAMSVLRRSGFIF